MQYILLQPSEMNILHWKLQNSQENIPEENHNTVAHGSKTLQSRPSEM